MYIRTVGSALVLTLVLFAGGSERSSTRRGGTRIARQWGNTDRGAVALRHNAKRRSVTYEEGEGLLELCIARIADNHSQSYATIAACGE